MKKMNMKTKRTVTISALLVVSMILIGTIYVITNKEIPNDDLMIDADSKSGPFVESIVEQEEEVITVEALEIKTDTTTRNEDSKVGDVTIDEPMAKEPEKPENGVPEQSTEENVKDEQLTQPDQNKDGGSTLVPDSQNPFANPANAGIPNEMNSSDYSDYVPGTGDKF